MNSGEVPFELGPLDLAEGPIVVDHLLVPLDGSEFAEQAFAMADQFAPALGATVTAVSVCESRLGQSTMETYYEQLVSRTGRRDLTWTLPIDPDPGPAIAAAAHELTNPMVCMMSHGRGRVATSVLGSVARSVLTESQYPVLVGGSNLERRADAAALPIVACVDSGPATETVLRVASACAYRLEVALLLITVAEPTPPTLSDEHRFRRAHGPSVDADEYIAALGAQVRDASGLRCLTHAVYNPISAADGVVDFLRTTPAQLVVVATHNRAGARELLVGSETARIVRASPTPVLVSPLGA